MAVAVTQQTNETRVSREQKAADANAPKLPSDKFTITVNILQDYLEVPDERNLPDLWHHWANCSKRQELLVLSDLLAAYARGPDAFSVSTPVPTSKLVQDLLAFAFVGDSPDDTKTGIHPFIIAEGSAEHRQANLEVARLYGLLHSGDHSIMLSDLEQLKHKEVHSLPMNYFELERNIGMFGNFIGTVLGTRHALTQAYRTFWNLLSQGYRSEFQQIIDVKLYIKPAHILRSIQLVCYNWFAQRRARLLPQPPKFTFIIYNVMLNTYILPNLPPQIYKLAYPRPAAKVYTPATVSTASSTVGGQSVVSAVTLPTLISTPTTTAESTTTNKCKGTFQANLHPNKDLQQYLQFGTTIKELIGNESPPTLDDGSPICLSYYLRNGC
jgi:hypothetical protein